MTGSTFYIAFISTLLTCGVLCEQTTGITSEVVEPSSIANFAATEHHDLGLKTSINVPSSASIVSTVAPQISPSEIQPTSVKQFDSSELLSTVFKSSNFESQTSNDILVDFEAEREKIQNTEISPNPLPPPTRVAKNDFKDSASSTLMQEQETTTLPNDYPASSSAIESSINEFPSQLSTEHHSKVDSTSEECNSIANPGCLTTTTTTNQDTPSLESSDIKEKSQEIIPTLVLEASDGFCSEPDCYFQPTAAMLTQETSSTSISDSTTDHFLLSEAPHTSPAVGPMKKNSTSELQVKSERKADKGTGLPDIISGLLSVVGEGLTIATNYVKEENKRKKEAQASQASTNTPLVIFEEKLKPSRINNRGPPKLSEIPFENIPLEVLSSVQPGQSPIQVQQRPFHTRLKVTKTKRRPFFPGYTATGIPLPENLLPESDFPTRATSLRPDHSEPEKEVTTTYFPEVSNPHTTYFPTDKPLGHIYFPGDESSFVDSFENTTTYPTTTAESSTPTSTSPPQTTTLATTTRTITTDDVTENITPFIGPLRPSSPKPVFVTQRPVAKPVQTPRPPYLTLGQVFDDGPVKVVTANPGSKNPDVFDVVVTANQNFGNKDSDVIKGKPLNNYADILTEALPGEQFVSIDGKKTYFDIGPSSAPQETFVSNQKPLGVGSEGQYLGSALEVQPNDLSLEEQSEYYEAQPILNRPVPPSLPPSADRPSLPVAPPVRIDTCIVGDDTTCTKEKNEFCKTSLGISSCFCKPGYGRKKEGQTCKKVVQLLMSMQVDRINQARLHWNSNYLNPNSREYRVLADEATKAISSAMSLTSLNGMYISNEINRFFPLNGKVTVKATLVLTDNPHTRSLVVKRDIQRKLIEVIQARNNNIGNGRLFVDGPLNPIPGVADLNECEEPEMNDCSEQASCINQFGTFTCKCLPGYGDRFQDDPDKAGRYCESCSSDFCNGRGDCTIDTKTKEKVCQCKGNYYGRQCELDGEVVAVAVGASVAAVIIIILTLTCLCMWSRKWKREQQKTEILRNFPPYVIPGTGSGYSAPVSAVAAANYMANLNKAAAVAAGHLQQQIPIAQSTPTTLSTEKRSRWISDNYSQNIYAQVHTATPAQFQPGAGGSSHYSEPVYSYPVTRPVLTLSPPFSPPPPPPQFTRNDASMYGTLPRNFGPEVESRKARRQSIMDARHLNQYATFRLSPAEVGIIMQPQNLRDIDSGKDLMFDEETVRATRFNSTQLSFSAESSSDDYDSSSSEEKPRAPIPPPRNRPTPEDPTLSPCSQTEEKVRSLSSTSTGAYKPLPGLPNEENDYSSSDNSSETPHREGSPSVSSSKRLTVTFGQSNVIKENRVGLLRQMFQKKTAPGLPAKPKNSTPTPILVARPLASASERKHLPLGKRLSNKLREPFGQKDC